MREPVNHIKDIVKATGLPLEIWPSVRPPREPLLEGCHYRLRDQYRLTNLFDFENSRVFECTRIHENTITALQTLPAEQVLGSATLLRTTQLTAMVSIAEAAYASLEENYCQLLWAMVKLIESGLRSGGRGYQTLQWEVEISYADHIRRTRPLAAESDGLADALIDVREQQQRLQYQVEVIRRQNEEILRLLRTMSQGYYESGGHMQSQEDETARSSTAADEKTPKYYSARSFEIALRKKDGQWFLYTDHNKVAAFAFLVDWLDVQLGRTRFQRIPRAIQSVNRGDKTESPERSGDAARQNRSETSGCWRGKILSGNVLNMPTPEGKEIQNLEFRKQPPFHSPETSDCLILTAAALWALFDNSLERMQNCQCTFRAAGKDYIQCRSERDGWLLWHTFSDEAVCEGRYCDSNIRIALTAEEAGQRLYTTTPCALGWVAMGRSSPSSTIWKTLSATTEFKRKTAVKYTVKEFQALAQLSAPAAVSPLIGGAITFVKRYYEIANSIDHESIIAMEQTAAAVVLIYDEKRGVHLTCDGADVIEMCCLQYLREMGCSTMDLPPFSHSSALLRLQTWYSSKFLSVRGTYVTGDHLVRQATKKISQLLETTQRAFKEGDLLYWLLEDVLGIAGRAIKAPPCKHASWHKLAFAAPPLILVVGEVDGQFLALGGTPSIWGAPEKKSTPSFRQAFGLSSIFDKQSAAGGIAGSQEIAKRWLVQAHAFTRVQLLPSGDEVIYGSKPTDAEGTYKVCEHDGTEAIAADSVFSNCTCKLTKFHPVISYPESAVDHIVLGFGLLTTIY